MCGLVANACQPHRHLGVTPATEGDLWHCGLSSSTVTVVSAGRATVDEPSRSAAMRIIEHFSSNLVRSHQARSVVVSMALHDQQRDGERNRKHTNRFRMTGEGWGWAPSLPERPP